VVRGGEMERPKRGPRGIKGAVKGFFGRILLGEIKKFGDEAHKPGSDKHLPRKRKNHTPT